MRLNCSLSTTKRTSITLTSATLYVAANRTSFERHHSLSEKKSRPGKCQLAIRKVKSRPTARTNTSSSTWTATDDVIQTRPIRPKRFGIELQRFVSFYFVCLLFLLYSSCLFFLFFFLLVFVIVFIFIACVTFQDWSSAPAPRLCHVIKWNPNDGFGFHLLADKTRKVNSLFLRIPWQWQLNDFVIVT